MATVYDKSSLFLAPSGVSNGTVFVQKPVPIYGSEQVTNGDFSQTGAEEVRNGDFSDGTYWSTPTGWSINNGTLQGTNVNAISATQSGFSFLNKSFRVEYTITEISQGDIKVYLGGSQNTPQRSAVGTYVEYIDITSANATLYIQGINNFTGKIDNVSVKELGQDWTLGTGWSIGEDKAVHTGTQSLIGKSNILTIGKTYKITFDLSGADGSNYARLLQSQYPNGGNYTSNGTISVHTITNIDDLYIYGVGDISITNISVQEVLSPAGDFTFTRGSNLSATRVNEAQLIEKGRENLLLQSNAITTAPWQNTLMSRTSGQAGYDGSNDAWKIESLGANASIYQIYTGFNSVCTYSIYAKAGSVDWIRMNLSGAGNQYFDIANGVVGAVGGGVLMPTITSIGNGWYKCTITNITGNFQSGAYVFTATADGSLSLSSGDNVYIQDAQLEQGMVATDYIETGASTAQAGILEDMPRLDYSGGASCPSLLLEPQRSNLFTQSEYFNSSDWVKTNVTATNNSAISPDGLQNATLINDGTASTTQHWFYQPITLSSGTTYTISFYAKYVDRKNMFINVYDGVTSNFVFYDIQNGVVLNADGNAVRDIVDVGSGWYRITYTRTIVGSGANFRIGMANDTPIQTYTGENKEALIYGLQAEAASYPTSYIPAYGTSQTRAGDNTAALDLSPFGLNGEDVTHFIEFKNNQAIARDNGGTSFRFNSTSINFGSLRIYRSNSNSKQLTIVFQDTNGDFVPNGYEITSLNPKVAIKRVWSTGEIKVFADGNKVIDTASTLFNSWNIVYMEGTGSTVEVKQLVSFPTALSDLDCEILTGATTYGTFDEMALALNYTVYE